MKVIVTGGSGFIGRYVKDQLKDEHELHILVRNNRDYFKTSPGVSCWQTDYSFQSLDHIFKETEPDAVVHLAAVRPGKKLELSDYIPNLTISVALFEACLKRHVSNIVNISSQSVYSHLDEIPWTEDRFTHPLNGYGLSKKWVEHASEYFNEKGLFIKTLRIGQVIGLGEREGYVLQIYLKNALEKKPLEVYGTGRGKRHYIYVKDVVAAIKKSLDHPEVTGTFNIGMKKNYSFYVLAETINSVLGNEAGIEVVEDKPAEEQENLMRIDKAQDILGWEPSYSLEEAFRDMKRNLL